MRRTFAVVALATLAVSALAACGSDPQDGVVGAGGTSAAPVTTAPTTSDAGATAPEALRFEAPLVGGGNLDFRSLSGTTVALWFWAPT